MRATRARAAVLPVATALAALGTAAILAAAGGHSSAAAIRALWEGAFGSANAILSSTLVRATPLILLGLSVALAFRAGLLNIGGEGQFVVGAIAGFATALTAGSLPRPVSLAALLLAGAIAGALWAGIAAWLKDRHGVFEVISTLMLNFVAALVLSYLVRGPLQEPTHVYPASVTLADAAHLPRVVAGFQLHAGFAIALVTAGVLWWIMRSTAAGFRIRAVGASPAAAASAGQVRVRRVLFGSFLVSGAIAGLAGAIQSSGVTYALYEGLSPGYGYSAIAVALLARLNPLAVVLAGIGFGALGAGADAMQRDAGIPAQFVSVIEAVVILAALALERASVAGTRPATGTA